MTDLIALKNPAVPFHDGLQLAGETIREKIASLAAALRAGTPQELPLREYFVKNPHSPGKGMYAREIFIPAGFMLVGKIHKYEHLNIISKGDISVITENGPQRVRAPYTMVSPPGTERAGYAHEDTVWTTIHSTDETDPEKIEEIFIAKSHEEYALFCESIKLIGEA
jgi:hypothetical protein